MTCHCRDFSRTRLLREAVAEAGRGLPAIEPGQPLPAGTGLDRRTFLLRSSALALSVYGAGRLGPDALGAGIAKAQEAASGQRVLVSVFLEGGVDSLSLLAPLGDSNYRRLRPTLAVPRAGTRTFAEDDRLRWHPAAGKLARLHEEGKVSVLPAVGYDSPDQSHFTSRHFYEVGGRRTGLRTGWLGRFLDVTGAPDNPIQGLALSKQLAPVLATERHPVSAMSDVVYHYAGTNANGPWLAEYIEKLGAAHLGSADAAIREVAETALTAGQLSGELSPPRGWERSRIRYPNSRDYLDASGGGQGAGGDQFPRRLYGLAALLGAGYPIHAAALTGPGDHDTHAQQEASFTKNVRLTADSLYAFQHDLEARGIADRVLTHVWSEFGRRGAENGSRGTDHGAAGSGFLIGTAVRGRMLGEFPGLRRLDGDGNLRATSDFRSLYCSILEQWLDTDAAAVIPDAGRFGRYSLLRQ